MSATTSTTEPRARIRWLWLLPRLVAAVLAFSVEGIYLSVIPNQVQLWWGYGVFFFVAAAGMGILGVSLLFDNPRRWTLWLGVPFNLALIAIWIYTRLGGLPPGEQFIALPAGALDVAATVMQLLLVVALLMLGVLGRQKDA